MAAAAVTASNGAKPQSIWEVDRVVIEADEARWAFTKSGTLPYTATVSSTNARRLR